MSRAFVIAAFVVGVVGSSAGCPINGVRDGIGVACTVDGDVCPFDHTCLPDDAADPNDGLCAPILDYGSCPAPAYAQKAQKKEDKDVVVDAADDVAKLEDVATIAGQLRIQPPGPTDLLTVGDLCGFEGVQHVGGALLVVQTDITTLDGLQNLSFVGNGVLVNGNGELVDVLGLQNLIVAVPPDGRDFGIALANNRKLDEDAIKALRDALADSAPGVKVFNCGNKNSAIALCPNLNDLLD